MELFTLRPGRNRLLISVPHAGAFVPPAIAARMTEAALAVPDTDWHVDRLYESLGDTGATVLVATHSRYVVDLNRPPDGTLLYPGQAESGICPTTTFEDEPIYGDGQEPDREERGQRIERYWRPYHDCLRAELQRLRARHGTVVLWDAHSIRSQVPRLFQGELPVLNFGTNDGRACGAELAARLLERAHAQAQFSVVLDGRFKGGYITRAYGDPAQGIHAVQLELAQRSYMNEAAPELFLPRQATEIGGLLTELLAIAAG